MPAGRDVVGKALTGSGKTLAFGLTIVARAAAAGSLELRRSRASWCSSRPVLAAQVQRELAALIDERASAPSPPSTAGSATARSASSCPWRQRRSRLPGRSRTSSPPATWAHRADLVVLDEADRMAHGFMPACAASSTGPPATANLLFSATLDGQSTSWCGRTSTTRCTTRGGHHDALEVTTTSDGVPRGPRPGHRRIINRAGSTIVFTRTRHGADRVTRQLGRYGVKAVPIHGRRSQRSDQALRQFSTGRAPALIATDVAARGIHVDAVGCVGGSTCPTTPRTTSTVQVAPPAPAPRARSWRS